MNYNPDMVINLGFSSDGSETVRQLIESGIGPERQFAATGLYSPTLWEQVDASNPAVLDGMLGISQTAKGNDAFKQRLSAEAGDYLAYAAEGYDCVILLALAARTVGDPSDGEAMMAAIAKLTHEGVECTSYGECAALIDEGQGCRLQRGQRADQPQPRRRPDRRRLQHPHVGGRRRGCHSRH